MWGAPTLLAVALDVHKGGKLDSISCWEPGSCGAAGTYATASGTEAFVDVEKFGVWGPAATIGAILNPMHSASIGGIDCPDGKFCSLVGDGTTAAGLQGFAASWIGSWHPAIAEDAPGGAHAWFDAISCNRQGYCSAGGDYGVPGTGGMEDDAFIVNQVNDVWQPSVEIAAALNQGGRATVSHISCVLTTYCAAVGEYSGMGGTGAQGFTDVKVSSTWAPAHEVPGSPSDPFVDGAGANAVACTSPGNCVAGGVFGREAGPEAYVVDETSGVWHNAKVVAQNLNSGENAATESMSCSGSGDCIAAGYFNTTYQEAFVVTETGGSWGSAARPTGLPTANFSEINAATCAPSFCALGGQYKWSGHDVAFVSTT